MENNYPDTHIESSPEQEQTTDQKSGLKRFFLDLLETLLIAVVLFVGINALTSRIRVEGFSMEPTLHNGELVLVNKLAYKFGTPQRGDVIVFRPPRNPEQEYIKRIIGLPGEEVVVSQRQVSIDGQILEEPYIAGRPTYESRWNVPQGSVFVLGDNRNQSSDSHEWGPVTMEQVIGKALLVYWPPNRWRLIEHPATLE